MSRAKQPTVAQSLWHRRSQAMCIGCQVCRDLNLCGGIKIDRKAYDCTDLCLCSDPGQCQYVCPNNPQLFVARSREVNGFEFDDIGSAPTVEFPSLPSFVPLIYNSSCRVKRVHSGSIALPIAKFFSAQSGIARFQSKEEVSRSFQFASTASLIVVSIDFDQPLENYWSWARGAGFHEQLVKLRPALVTTPNFSLFGDVPRWDNFYNMKRIAICWYELASLGLPTALHVNARTDRDWQRWREFLRAHEEINAIAFEFATGAASPIRGLWHAEKLVELAENLGRPLQLILRGGRQFLRELASTFRRVTFVSSDPFIKTTRRRRLRWRPGSKANWVRVLTLKGQPLDDLLQHNIDVFGQMIELMIRGNAGDDTAGKTDDQAHFRSPLARRLARRIHRDSGAAG